MLVCDICFHKKSNQMNNSYKTNIKMVNRLSAHFLLFFSSHHKQLVFFASLRNIRRHNSNSCFNTNEKKYQHLLSKTCTPVIITVHPRTQCTWTFKNSPWLTMSTFAHLNHFCTPISCSGRDFGRRFLRKSAFRSFCISNRNKFKKCCNVCVDENSD